MDMKPTAADPIPRLRELLASATPGEWTATQDVTAHWHVDAGPEREYSVVADVPTGKRNAAIIAESHNALPALLDRIERAEDPEYIAHEQRLVDKLNAAATNYARLLAAARAVREIYGADFPPGSAVGRLSRLVAELEGER